MFPSVPERPDLPLLVDRAGALRSDVLSYVTLRGRPRLRPPPERDTGAEARDTLSTEGDREPRGVFAVVKEWSRANEVCRRGWEEREARDALRRLLTGAEVGRSEYLRLRGCGKAEFIGVGGDMDGLKVAGDEGEAILMMEMSTNKHRDVEYDFNT